MPLLSVLICTIPGRDIRPLLATLDDERIELLYLGDNLKMTVGEKRNRLLSIASGDYISFIDDDDAVSPDYVSKLLAAIEFNTEVITFRVGYSGNGSGEKPVYYSKSYSCDRNFSEYYERLPNHLMCVKRELAIKVGFKKISFGEDQDYAQRLKPLLVSEHQIPEVLYHYQYDKYLSRTRHYSGR